MKKFVSKMMVIACLLGMLGSTLAVNAEADVEKPTQVQNVSKVVSGNGKITLTWDAAYKQSWGGVPSGYTVYMKEKGGKYRAVKNTKKTECSIKNLNESVTYYAKVRAYNKSGKKKYYGQYSEVLKFQMQNWIYLPDLTEPYISLDGFSTYNNGEYFMMNGEKQYNGYTFQYNPQHINDSKLFSINLGDKFKKLQFNLGQVDGTGSLYGSGTTIYIYQDDVLATTVHRINSDLYKNVTLDTTDTYKLSIKCVCDDEIKGDGWDHSVDMGISDVKAYY